MNHTEYPALNMAAAHEAEAAAWEEAVTATRLAEGGTDSPAQAAEDARAAAKAWAAAAKATERVRNLTITLTGEE